MGFQARIERTKAATAAAVAGVVFIAAPCYSDIIVDHPPHPFGGPDSDTSFRLFSGQSYWQRLADDFSLASPDVAIGLTFWGFYNEDNPPATETIRIRILGARPGDMLPDESNVLSETTVQNPSREWTGRIVLANVDVREYRFQASLASPVILNALTPYWLEVVQIGEITTRFRWENSVADLTGHTFINPATGNDWRHTSSGVSVDLAFQLISPEPASAAIICLGLGFLARRRLIRRDHKWRKASLHRSLD